MTVMVRMSDVRAVHMCSGGARAFFRRHNLDWSAFLKEGLPVETIEATGDAMALRCAAHARARAARESVNG